MLVIGLTGGIGSGKSITAQLFSEKGIPIIDADVISHQLTASHQPAVKIISEHFGQDIILTNGQLNRKKLRDIIFQDPNERIWLENLLHPLIRMEIKRQIHTLSSPYCIIVIPLLLEALSKPENHEAYDFLSRILVIDAPSNIQIARTSQRDHTDEQSVQSIINVQINREDRLNNADDIIINNGTLTDLKSEVEKLHQLYLSLSS
jgi:dephospho-CoA kinase